ncbi:MAG: hypothetical protein ACRDP3_10420 [Streptomyces sp.]|uniref:hypothetical protein n=1 Tax=Streptomyces sp. TaxID=1931 RepID=UPI003D6AE837
MSLPAADELFRTTGGSAVQPSAPAQQHAHSNGAEPAGASAPPPASRVPAPASEPAAESTTGPDTGTTDDTAGAGGAADRSGRDEHSTAADGDRGRDGPVTAAGSSGAEHAGREGGGQDKQATARRATVPGQGGAQSAGRARAGQEGRSGSAEPRRTGSQQQAGRGEPNGASSGSPSSRRGRGANRRPSGRERHDEKITVYVAAEELMDLEHARLVLRGEHGLAVDRGRIVREAVAVVLADLESRGEASILVRRLRGR